MEVTGEHKFDAIMAPRRAKAPFMIATQPNGKPVGVYVGGGPT